MCRQVNGTFTNCDPTNSSDVPSIQLGNFFTALAISNVGVITGTTTATTAASVPLNVNLEPSYTSGEAIITWTETGTICDEVRGIPNGKGDC